MEETGKVIKTEGGRAEVEVAVRGECEHCAARGMCNWTGQNTSSVIAVNQAGAVVGDCVILRTGHAGRSYLIVFGIPALGMVVGVLVGGLLLKQDLWSGILAGVGLVLGLGVIKLIDLAAGRSGKTLPVIVRVIGPDETQRHQEHEAKEGSDGPQT